jgi:hypothetical protein
MNPVNSERDKLRYEWQDLPWKAIERTVFKLQKRIYQASKDGQVQKYTSSNGFCSVPGRSVAWPCAG